MKETQGGRQGTINESLFLYTVYAITGPDIGTTGGFYERGVFVD